MITQKEGLESLTQQIEVPRIIKTFGYSYMFTSFCAIPAAVLWMTYALIHAFKGFEILFGTCFLALMIFNFFVGNGMVQGNVRALRVFLFLNNFNVFYFIVNRRIEEYLDEVEKIDLSNMFMSLEKMDSPSKRKPDKVANC